MYQIGDNIAYPMQGAGTITDIQHSESGEETESYYILSLPFSKMNVMIPVSSSGKVGVRPVISKDEIMQVMETLGEETQPMPSNWNRRFRENTEKLKTGDIYVVAGVVRDLVRGDRNKKLSTGENKLLNNAKQILESELVLAGGITLDEAETMVMDHI